MGVNSTERVFYATFKNFTKYRIPQAVKSGASAVVISDNVDIPEDITVIKVDDTRKALAYMSAMLFGEPEKELTTIALTGTKGKTTTVAMLKSILDAEGIKSGTIGTLGIIIGNKIYKTNNTTPESYEIQHAMRMMVDAGCKVMIIEASSQTLAMTILVIVNTRTLKNIYNARLYYSSNARKVFSTLMTKYLTESQKMLLVILQHMALAKRLTL